MTTAAINYFAHATAARRYAAARPYFHPLVIDRVRTLCGIATRLPVALDVACGTGQSAVAALAIADRVVACDVAPDMLREAPPDPRIAYACSAGTSTLSPDTSYENFSFSSISTRLISDAVIGCAIRGTIAGFAEKITVKKIVASMTTARSPIRSFWPVSVRTAVMYYDLSMAAQRGRFAAPCLAMT